MTREEAIEILTEIQTKHKKYIGQTECNNALNIAIEALLSADRQKSKWIYHMTEGVVKTISCSQCSAWYDVTIPEQIATFNFCPNCGARMDGKEQEHE